MEIYISNIGNKLPDQIYRDLLESLPEEKQKRIRRFIKWQDSQRTLMGDILIRNLICNKLEIKNEKIKFDKNNYGKPFLSGYKDLQFNISHSGEWVAIAVDEKTVGIDIQQVKPINMDIARRYFSDSEYRDLMSKPDSEKIYYFYDLWTLKESFIKAEGMGLSIPLNAFSFKIKNDRVILSNSYSDSQYYFKQYKFSSDYRLSVCSENKDFPQSMVEINFIEVAESFLKS